MSHAESRRDVSGAVFCFAGSSSVVILQGYVVGVAILEAKRDAPITCDPHAPCVLAIASELVKFEAWNIQAWLWFG